MVLYVFSDHYTGITDPWSAGNIYCSEMTARLVVHLLGVKPEYVQALPMDVPQDIQGHDLDFAIICNFSGLLCSTRSWPLYFDKGLKADYLSKFYYIAFYCVQILTTAMRWKRLHPSVLYLCRGGGDLS